MSAFLFLLFWLLFQKAESDTFFLERFCTKHLSRFNPMPLFTWQRLQRLKALRPGNYPVPSCRPILLSGITPYRASQLVPGSGEGQNTMKQFVAAQSYVRSGTGLQSAHDSCRGIGIMTSVCISFLHCSFSRSWIVLTPYGSS
jgi:hypothetical protein